MTNNGEIVVLEDHTTRLIFDDHKRDNDDGDQPC